MEERLGGGPARGALALVLALAWAAARAADEPRLEFPHAISSLAVSRRRLLVASGNCWYDVEPSLASRGPRHCREAHEGSVNKLLLPLGDGRLLTCWTEPRGSCYLQRVGATDSPPKEFGQELVSCLSRGSAAGTVYHNPGSGWYLVTATTHSLNDSAEQCTPADSAARIAVNIKGEDQVVSEGRQLTMAKENFLFFVDVFLWNKHFFFPYYHYNLSMEPRMLISKQDLSNNDFQFHGQKVLQCDRRTQILSSAYIQERALWVGIFASGKVDLAPTSTALCIFDLSQVVYNLEGSWPVNNATSLSHSNLASVYGIVILNKTVLFLGTGNGQLLKVILDENMEPNCPDILYEIAKETAIFHKLELDPTDEDYIYLPSNNEIRRIQVANCSKHVSCKDCLSAMDPHCGWCHSKTSCTLKGECSFTNNSENWASIVHGTDKCLKIYTSSKPDRGEPMSITSIEPAWISPLGKSGVLVIGENFTGSNILMEITGTSSCKPDVISVTEILNHTHMKFCLPPSHKEVKSVCIKEEGFQCSSSKTVHYVSFPECFEILPNISWKSGGRNITIRGKYLNITDTVIILDESGQILTVSIITSVQFTCHRSGDECKFTTPALTSEKGTKMANIVLNVEGKHFPCITLQYDPDPQFIHYELTLDLDPELELKIHKQNDNLNITRSEIEVFLSYMDSKERENLTFTVQDILNTKDHSIIHCRTKRKKTSKIDTSSVKVYVSKFFMDNVCKIVIFPNSHSRRSFFVAGFVELQVEKSDVVDSFGTIPFLDYKHFVLRTFFPESGVPNHKDESSIALYALINNKNFLVTLIHTLEKQKTFSVKDRCLFASFLTIALQRNLVYLTNILEVLTRDLMEQSSNVHPKLMLRRTESVVEKLLTNWMSVCLSGFLRETVGEPFYMLVTTLNQRINKGPVDVITCKALYTLNEDWLLWQVTEFSTVVLDVVFEKIQENESEGTTMKIQVNVLDCDTIGQAKEKILQAFLNKNGFPFGLQLSEMGLALQSGTQAKELLDVDSSTVILQDGITKLNTIGHYGVRTRFLTLLKICFYGEYADDYCHLILPDSEAAKETQGAKHTGKQKFKVKEMYLTKLLSTKVAIHSVVEKLFRSIWTLPNNKAPVAIKYFFDFLDAQVENKKITDPDVIHIWKTNSLPLRFWVNILKNPQFVFDIKKTPHIDGCLSVIAQAFMDAFSLSEQQLGKEAPTNKLLYAKDIPLYREEVKAFYKAIKDLPSLSTSELEEFLTQESKKHENEFNEAVALNKIYQYIARYFDEILNKLDKERGLEEAQKQLLNVKDLFDTKKKCKWI
uniref:Plexin C1 n=1 Tax=Varanus komodoensis TaxID=61221 RepID=A0A8D2LG41_VARKO